MDVPSNSNPNSKLIGIYFYWNEHDCHRRTDNLPPPVCFQCERGYQVLGYSTNEFSEDDTNLTRRPHVF